jgi:SAM-dependent methyltransferase
VAQVTSVHPVIFQEFEAICAPLAVTGHVLEIGASPDHRSLLELPSLRSAVSRVGVGLDGSLDGDHFTILDRNAHDLSCFGDGSFELILCNSTLEHDERFWLTIAEAHRLIAPGGWIVFGVPGYAATGSSLAMRPIKRLSRLPLIGQAWTAARVEFEASSVTLGRHDFPADYYRFSEQAMIEVLLGGLEHKETRVILSPPRVIGLGRKAMPGIVDAAAASESRA